MDNFKKFSYASVNGNLVIDGKLMPRSLVLFNDKGVVYNVVAKVKDNDKRTMVRALAKAMLASLHEEYLKNNTKAAQESKKKVYNRFTPALSSFAMSLTDKNGALVKDSMWSVRYGNDDSSTFREMMRVKANMPIYELVVKRGLAWSDETVIKALQSYITAALEQLSYVKDLDAALGRAADSNEAEAAKAEAEKAKAEAEAEAKKAKKAA